MRGLHIYTEIKQATRKTQLVQIRCTEGAVRTQQNSAGAACVKPHVA